eukprot:CAMPEP_0202920152 /NCGR_PEP_ID=MMETSP1392-20130828/76707_1 /ASSEMBLY_ACC=CAM_ASM_000868 /TAXON_ID=225041 /ORGANISM="Chlamydomonas chlamydogama, Strain SAG 11-48b" /LENGTH=259 /DNA_ID=CAMNT_0049613635 /DNA_START=1785 /DNA_END=2564 /DNA_ORIENTATION=+
MKCAKVNISSYRQCISYTSAAHQLHIRPPSATHQPLWQQLPLPPSSHPAPDSLASPRPRRAGSAAAGGRRLAPAAPAAARRCRRQQRAPLHLHLHLGRCTGTGLGTRGGSGSGKGELFRVNELQAAAAPPRHGFLAGRRGRGAGRAAVGQVAGAGDGALTCQQSPPGSHQGLGHQGLRGAHRGGCALVHQGLGHQGLGHQGLERQGLRGAHQVGCALVQGRAGCRGVPGAHAMEAQVAGCCCCCCGDGGGPGAWGEFRV